MGPPEPSQFYTGIVAELYGPLRSAVPDPEPYAFFIGRSGEPALELGCGDGDPILDLRARGIDVEGLDSSADMLQRCRDAALERGIDPHHAGRCGDARHHRRGTAGRRDAYPDDRPSLRS